MVGFETIIHKPMAIPVFSIILSVGFLFLVRYIVLKRLKPKLEEYINEEKDNRVESFRGFLTAIIEGGLAATAISIGIAYYFLNLLFTMKTDLSMAANVLQQVASIGNIFVIISNMTAFGTYIAGAVLITAGISDKKKFKSLSKIQWFILFVFILAITTISLYTLRVIAYLAA